ncbi:hypothetical protein [Oceanicella sp. SM1341]|uniref:hypothetical protein n=1 Tax=Oceanicella sp. SM1341 TaxID=1548889 RepID=UPI000E4EA661|nr:hypothetical protein [Oceanicella sp. SM1341]
MVEVADVAEELATVLGPAVSAELGFTYTTSQFWSKTRNLGLGTETPAYALHIQQNPSGASGLNLCSQVFMNAVPSAAGSGQYGGMDVTARYNSTQQGGGDVWAVRAIGEATNTGLMNTLMGIWGRARYSGSGNGGSFGSLYGVRAQAEITSSGHVNHVMALKTEDVTLGTGSCNHAWGIYVSPLPTSGVTDQAAAIHISARGVQNCISFAGTTTENEGGATRIYAHADGGLKLDRVGAALRLDLSSLPSYADDAAAAAAGVIAVGEAYVNSATGALHRRLA